MAGGGAGSLVWRRVALGAELERPDDLDAVGAETLLVGHEDQVTATHCRSRRGQLSASPPPSPPPPPPSPRARTSTNAAAAATSTHALLAHPPGAQVDALRFAVCQCGDTQQAVLLSASSDDSVLLWWLGEPAAAEAASAVSVPVRPRPRLSVSVLVRLAEGPLDAARRRGWH